MCEGEEEWIHFSYQQCYAMSAECELCNDTAASVFHLVTCIVLLIQSNTQKSLYFK